MANSVRTTVSLPEDLHQDAKDNNINISKATRKQLRCQLGKEHPDTDVIKPKEVKTYATLHILMSFVAMMLILASIWIPFFNPLTLIQTVINVGGLGVGIVMAWYSITNALKELRIVQAGVRKTEEEEEEEEDQTDSN